MRKILFNWNGFNVYSYPAMLYLGMLAGVFAGAYVAQLSGMDANLFAVATLGLIVPALVGSRLLFVFTHWDVYRRDLSRIWRRSEGGMAMYGGLIMTVPLSIPLLRAMHLPFAEFWDAATFTILLGMIFTRIGCLLNGCCAGRPTSAWFGCNLPDHRGIWQRRIPTQILEMTVAAMILGAVILIWDRKPPAGTLFCLAIVAYGATRFLLEPLRGRDTAILRTTSLLLVVATLAAGIVFVWFR
jgi:phosphatidylglycerol---prolipoprotein diacylglyceryl transferase